MTVSCHCVSVLSESARSSGKEHSNERSHLAVVACGTRLEETLNMLKSAVLLSKKPLQFHIFAEDDLHDGFRKAVSHNHFKNTPKYSEIVSFAFVIQCLQEENL